MKLQITEMNGLQRLETRLRHLRGEGTLNLRMERSAELKRKFIGLNGTLFSYCIVCLLKEIYMLDLS